MTEKPKNELWKNEKESPAELIRTDDKVIMPTIGAGIDFLYNKFESMSPEVRDQYRHKFAAQDRAIKIFPDGAIEITPATFTIVIEKRDI